MAFWTVPYQNYEYKCKHCNKVRTAEEMYLGRNSAAAYPHPWGTFTSHWLRLPCCFHLLNHDAGCMWRLKVLDFLLQCAFSLYLKSGDVVVSTPTKPHGLLSPFLASLRLCNLRLPPSSHIALTLLTQTKLGQTSRAFVSFCLPGILSLLILSLLVILHQLKFRDFPWLW